MSCGAGHHDSVIAIGRPDSATPAHPPGRRYGRWAHAPPHRRRRACGRHSDQCGGRAGADPRRPRDPNPCGAGRGQVGDPVTALDHVEIGLNQSNLEKRDRPHMSGAGCGRKTGSHFSSTRSRDKAKGPVFPPGPELHFDEPVVDRDQKLMSIVERRFSGSFTPSPVATAGMVSPFQSTERAVWFTPAPTSESATALARRSDRRTL